MPINVKLIVRPTETMLAAIRREADQVVQETVYDICLRVEDLMMQPKHGTQLSVIDEVLIV